MIMYGAVSSRRLILHQIQSKSGRFSGGTSRILTIMFLAGMS
ncbi:hypothetical protein NC651_012227 [Populus alba x Populus x berolinensis]|nr:hypothetical protein NC651_012227 [Populus alba x Populus x berolinensis]